MYVGRLHANCADKALLILDFGQVWFSGELAGEFAGESAGEPFRVIYMQ